MSSEVLEPAVPKAQQGVIVLSLLLLDPARVKVILLTTETSAHSFSTLKH